MCVCRVDLIWCSCKFVFGLAVVTSAVAADNAWYNDVIHTASELLRGNFASFLTRRYADMLKVFISGFSCNFRAVVSVITNSLSVLRAHFFTCFHSCFTLLLRVSRIKMMAFFLHRLSKTDAAEIRRQMSNYHRFRKFFRHWK